MGDFRPNIAAPLALLGRPATLTIPGGQPVAIRAIRLPPVSVETTGVMVSTDRPQVVLALSRATAPSIPRGTVISMAPYDGGPIETWVVEGILGGETSGEPHPDDDVRVLVMRS